MSASELLLDIYSRLQRHYGPQRWWPGDTRFEVMVGAVLTQSAAWPNVERAIARLRAAGALSPAAIRELSQHDLAKLVYSSGYYNAKAKKLKALAEYLGERFGDDLEAMAREPKDALRTELMGVHGIGEETADDILLYAADKPAFVIDAYTRRVFARLGLASEAGSYSTYQAIFEDNLTPDPELFGEYHALIVAHAKRVCRKGPLCRGCCLLEVCPTGKDNVTAAAASQG